MPKLLLQNAEPEGKMETLPPRRRLFVLEYLKDLNATAAANRAGYSAKTAAPAASRLLKNVKVRAAVQAALNQRERRIEFDADRVLQELARLSFANILDYVTILPDGSLRPDLSNLDRQKAAAISELIVEEQIVGKGKHARKITRTKIKLSDKGANLERLGKHFKVFADGDLEDEASRIAEVKIRQMTSAIFRIDKMSSEDLHRIVERAEQEGILTAPGS